MSAKLFYEHEPSCSYCLYSKRAGAQTVCGKAGQSRPSKKCKKFVYYPFARIPKQQPRLKSYTEDDFKL